MKLLLNITDKDFGLKKRNGKLRIRNAARAVIFDGNKIALMHVSKLKYYKLPGGGLNKNESLRDGLMREILEETGCKIKVISEIGKLIEYRTHIGVKQTSYCYKAQLISKGKNKLTEKERRKGFKVKWVTLQKAIELMLKSKASSYEEKFIIKRDYEILRRV